MRRAEANTYFLIFALGFCSIITAQLFLLNDSAYVHESDPRFFYEAKRGSATSGTLFYVALNKVFHLFSTEHAHQILLKSFNFLMFMFGIIWTGLHKKISRLGFFLIFFNPYFFLVLSHNIRDLYIYLGLILFLAVPGAWRYLGLFFTLMWRPFMAAIMFLAVFRLRIAFSVVLLVCFGALSFDGVRNELALRIASAFIFYGKYEGFYSEMISISEGVYSTAALFKSLEIFAHSVLVFLLTPFPPNWFVLIFAGDSNWFYTAYDEILILLGSLWYWLFVLPALNISKFLKYWRLGYRELIIFLGVVLLYSLLHLGGTDIRVKFVAMVALILCFDRCGCLSFSVRRLTIFYLVLCVGFSAKVYWFLI